MEKAAEFINGEESIRGLTAVRHASVKAPKKETPRVTLSLKKGIFSKKGEKGK